MTVATDPEAPAADELADKAPPWSSDPDKPFGCPQCAQAFTTDAGLKRHMTRSHKQTSAPAGEAMGSPPEAPSVGDGAAPAGGPEELGHPDEEAPQGPEPQAEQLRRRWREFTDPARRAERKRDRKRKAKARLGPRESLEQPAGAFYGWVGGALEYSQSEYVAVGRVMTLQAPAVGVMFDAAAEGTALDKIAQPIVQHGRRWRSVSDLVSLPVLTLLAIRAPHLLNLKRELVQTPDGPRESVSLEGPLASHYYAVWEANALMMAQQYERKVIQKEADRAELAKLPFLAPVIARGEDPVLWLIVNNLTPPQQQPDDTRQGAPT